jgi:hypothetical protein
MIKNSPNHDVKGLKDYPDFQNRKIIKSSSKSKKSRFRQLAAYE